MSQAYNETPSVEQLLKEIKELREREDYYKNIVESANKGIWVINNDYKTVYINYRMAEMLGTTIGEAMGKTVWKFLEDDDWHTFMDMLSRCHESCKEQFDIKFRRPDGRELWALAGLVPFFDRNGFRIEVSGTFVDITERKRMEMALKETKDNLLKAQHVGRMGSWVRDLKTDMFEASGEMGEILGVKIVPMTIEEVSRIIYSPEERERIRRISQEAIAGLSQVKGRDVRINFEPANACPVMANELLKDAFSHIIMNSIKHSSGSLTINVRLEEVQENGKGSCRVEFEDNGPGTPDEVKKKLLTGIQETEDKKSRIGLGLRFVKTLVDTYHGKVWMEDRVAGDYRKGVKVIVMLPMAE